MSIKTRVINAVRSLRGLPGPEDDYWYRPVGQQSLSSVNVTQDTALAMSAVYRAMRILSDSVASLPVYLYERQSDGSRRRAAERTANGILNRQPNSEMSPYRYRQNIMSSLLGWGNHYSYVGRNARGVRDSLTPLNPALLRVERNEKTSELQYIFTPQKGSPITLSSLEVLHIPSFGYNGIVGRSVITLAREAIGLGIAQEQWNNNYYGHGTHPGLVASHPGSPRPETVKNLKEAITAQVGGLDKSHNLLFLQDGIKLDSITITPVDADFIASRKFSLGEIGRFFGLPPHMLGDLERSIKANIEEEGINFLKYSLGPWLRLIESELNRFFLTPDERQWYYWEFLEDSFLRGDIKSRYQAYQIARANAWMTADEIRAKENMGPLPDGLGKHLITKPGTATLTQIASGQAEAEGAK